MEGNQPSLVMILAVSCRILEFESRFPELVPRDRYCKAWTHADSLPNCEEVVLSFYSFISYSLYNDYKTPLFISNVMMKNKPQDLMVLLANSLHSSKNCFLGSLGKEQTILMAILLIQKTAFLNHFFLLCFL